MSKVGCATLIQCNLESLLGHTIQCFQFSISITNSPDKINQEFLWKSSCSSKEFPLVAWDKVCKPKKYGGLGLRKAGATNRAFISKLIQKFYNKLSNFWVQQIRAKYCLPY